ncbi:MAG: hypothetical protein J0I41_05175 [Filimonas sp.]|nr:hypothetical protein [Filimonas sp.]
MDIRLLLAQHIIDVHEGDNWTEIDIKGTLEDVSFEEAITVIPASPNSIAMLVHHLTFYSNKVHERLQGIYNAIPASNGFEMPPVKSEKDWKKLKADNLRAANSLANEVKIFPLEQLFELTASGSSTYYKNVQGIIEHAHYHLGQMVLLKKIIRNNLL